MGASGIVEPPAPIPPSCWVDVWNLSNSPAVLAEGESGWGWAPGRATPSRAGGSGFFCCNSAAEEESEAKGGTKGLVPGSSASRDGLPLRLPAGLLLELAEGLD